MRKPIDPLVCLVIKLVIGLSRSDLGKQLYIPVMDTTVTGVDDSGSDKFDVNLRNKSS